MFVYLGYNIQIFAKFIANILNANQDRLMSKNSLTFDQCNVVKFILDPGML